MYHYMTLFLREAHPPPATTRQTSPGKNANFLSIYLSNVQQDVSDSLGLCFVMQTHPHPTA